MAIRLVIDSAADILPDESALMGMVHIPLTVIFDGEEYSDSINLSHREFYEKLIESDVLPTTSQITPATFSDVFKKIVSEGDTVLAITMSSELSGTYQSACIAAEDYPGKVFVIDSLNVTVGERILIERAKQLIDKGLAINPLIETLENEKKHIKLIAVLDTLEYLKKGGRISAATAFAGNLLAIKPGVAVVDGKVEMVGKARGSKNANNLLRNLIESCNGIDFNRPYSVAYSGLSDILVNKYLEDHADIWKPATDKIIPHTVGCTIGTHVGPGAIALAFFEKQI